MLFSRFAIWPALLAGLVCLGAGPVVRADEASITVDLAHPGGPVSPTLYGIFFEEINHAGDGGLYAEMVRNRSFEDAQGLSSWSVVSDGAATAKLALNTDSPLNSRNPRSLKLETSGTGTGRAGVANSGYWGMAVTKGHSYALSLYARREGAGPDTLVATLESPSGDVLAKGRVSGVGTEWKQFSCKLAAKEGAADARLVISPTTDGAVLLDQASLFPKRTWKGRENGLRRDLGNLVADLAPAFVRFPGGCFVEGDQLANASRWKESVGDPAARPGHWNLWGYRSTDGLGYHEFLQMCEDLGSEPLFVINCGMAHGGVVPMDQLEPWVQDALDALEYALGPVTSTWGAQRARNGHPKPFALRYMEIGNENGWGDTLPLYEERYARFYDAIKAIYPSVKLVANVPVSNRPMDLVDDHYYNSPEWFAGSVGRYDKQDRKGPRIYVGEYAVTSGCGQGNLRAALAEAAFMMGLERNSDIIEMASYAPLFVNVADRKWNPDAIVFDSATSFGTPSYHVQKLFARNRPDLLLP
ncbi:MAG TPA: alpha-L-arabinofuranosidase C-terminal domain-containing protein, partial [Armatimonadota bacterium]